MRTISFAQVTCQSQYERRGARAAPCHGPADSRPLSPGSEQSGASEVRHTYQQLRYLGHCGVLHKSSHAESAVATRCNLVAARNPVSIVSTCFWKTTLTICRQSHLLQSKLPVANAIMKQILQAWDATCGTKQTPEYISNMRATLSARSSPRDIAIDPQITNEDIAALDWDFWDQLMKEPVAAPL